MTNQLKHNTNFGLLWLAQVISGIGDVLYMVGIMVNVYQYTGSALQTAIVMVANTLPAFLVGPFAGAVVDKYDRKKVLIAMDILRIFLVLLLLLFISENHFNLLGLYAVVASLSVAAAFYNPAKMAIIPSVVESSHLTQANSLLIGTNVGIMALGYGLGGVLTLWINFEAFVLINAFTFIISALVIYFIQMPYLKVDKGEEKLRMFASIKQGYNDLRADKVAYPLVVMEILEYFPHGIWTSAILLVFVEKGLSGNADDWGFVASTYFGGMLVGAILATFIKNIIAERTGPLIIINAFITSILTLIFSWSSTVFMAIILGVAMGLPNALRDVAQDTLLQSTVSQKLLGRVYAFRTMFTSIMFMASGITFAWLADFVNIRYIYTAGAFLYLLTAIYALVNKALRESRIR